MWQPLISLIRSIQTGPKHRSRRLCPVFRQIAFENVESRTLLTASPWHNSVLPADVNLDGLVTSQDVDIVRMTIANSIVAQVQVVAGTMPFGTGLPDVTNDWWVNQADIDCINNALASAGGAGTGTSSTSGSGSGTDSYSGSGSGYGTASTSGSGTGTGSGSGSGSGSTSGTAPVIMGFSYEWTSTYLRIYGSVADDQDPTGRPVYFGGMLPAFMVSVEDNDTFELIIPGWTMTGTVSAWFTDSTGMTSQVVSMIVV